MPSVSVAEIALYLGASVERDSSRIITGANALGEASDSDLAFATGKPSLKQSQAAAAASKAGCLLVPMIFDLSGKCSIIRVADPRAAFARLLTVLYPPKILKPGIHHSAIVAHSARVALDAQIGPHVSIGEESVIEGGCLISAGCVIGDGVHVGKGSVLHPNVTVYDRVQIAERVVINANAVLGADGFGFTLIEGHYQKFPQVGTVDIQDDVEIGAGCCIDRAALGVTRIGRGTKLDNLIHVAHNCVLGEDVVVAAQTGFSGSVTVGDFAVIGGQSGIGEKARIESRAVLGGKAGVLTSATVRAGEPVWGIPARPLRQHLKGLANVNRLPELKEKVRQLEQQINGLREKLQERQTGEADYPRTT